MSDFPLLSVITFLPLVGLVILFALPRIDDLTARWIALIVSLIDFLLSLALLTGNAFNTSQMQFEEHYQWLPGIGISYHLGVDGLSILLVILTTLLIPISIAISWTSVQTRVREFHITMLLLATGLIGCFVALDIFLFYVFFELSLIPMALMIGVWGSRNRVYAALKFFIYTLGGSLLMLVAIIATYQRYFDLTGVLTLDWQQLSNPPLQQLGMTSVSQFYPVHFQYWVFAAFFIAFAIKVPMWPVHTWLPDAHTEAPTAGSVILAGIMLKIGGYGMMRFCLPLYPDAARFFAPAIMVLSTIAIIYGALVALPQPDWKRLVAYSSVSHMGFVTLGIFAFNQQAMQGATMVMFAHGLNTSALFLIVGIVYERAHTREIAFFRGLSTTMPIYSALFCAFMFASVGLPGMTGFVGEFHSLMGAFRGGTTLARVTAIVSTSVVIFAAWYMLWLFQRVAQGRPPGVAAATGHGSHGGNDAAEQPAETHGDHGQHRWSDINLRELGTLAPLLALTIVFGVWPGPIFQLVAPALAHVLRPFDGGAAAAMLGH
ncbi:MAG TPA: NADH-quinone oxidoreductase subunit M [Thermomicrobiales bacterium]|nr:NADH-quinone oxidoreductase subunit M [Thermomicrobiales bacterium]